MNHAGIDKMETPAYLVNKSGLLHQMSRFQTAFEKQWGKKYIIGYSVKSNHLQYLLESAREVGAYAEVVSKDEYDYVSGLGFAGHEIIYNGPQKERSDFIQALLAGSIVNIDNVQELIWMEENASQLHDARIGIRVNFDLEQKCPNETHLPQGRSRFGLCIDNGDFSRALERVHNAGLKLSCIAVHCETVTRSLRSYQEISHQLASIIQECHLQDEIDFIDLGGGFAGGYNTEMPAIEAYFEVICSTLRGVVDNHRVALIIEPGYGILASSVQYVCKVLHLKEVGEYHFVTVDGSLLDFNIFFGKRKQRCSVLGKAGCGLGANAVSQIICGSSTIDEDRWECFEPFPGLDIGDILVVHDIGAYTIGLKGCFINEIPAIYVQENDEIRLIRDRTRLMDKI